MGQHYQKFSKKTWEHIPPGRSGPHEDSDLQAILGRWSYSRLPGSKKNHCIPEQVLGHLMLAVYADGEGLSKEPPATDPDLEPDEPTTAAVVHEDVSVVGMLVDRPPSAHANLLVQTLRS